ncbi:MAG: tubulin-like doman-containing protein [Prevotellaceae bacterium]|jgi:hypothetical protein|nr:tubulin-like doman-containing protein [Prevotellaceae bacterium]
MAKLYVFGIGGTGSRVLKSLTMLLASGVDCPFDIVPVIIDRDIQNGDYVQASNLISNYIKVNKNMSSPDCKFFRTKISLVGQTDTTTGELCLQWNQQNVRFNDFINYTSLDNQNKALIEMLFSRETLEMDMSHGFQGNPNMGCVVQNQFEGNPLFDAFAKHFQTDDRIFIISSIFGGTGASGFPLLRKLLHKDRTTADGNWGPIKQAPIGAITVLPYYNVTSADAQDNSSVNAQDWNDKAKAALDYYQSENSHLDTLYYIGDTKPTTYPHCKGGVKQTDPAHIVEMAAALSIVDFAKIPTNNFNITNNGNNHETKYKEFGISDETQVDFSMLYQETQNTVVEPLSRFLLFAKYMGYNAVADNNPKQVKITDTIAKKDSNNHFDATGIKQPYANRKGFDAAFRTNELQELEFIQKNYVDWLIELEAQTRSFSPFKLEVSRADEFIKTLRLWNGALLNKNWERVTKILNDTHITIDEALSKSQKFLLLFSKITEILLTLKTR